MTKYTPSIEELRNAYRFHGRAVDDSRYKARGKPPMTDAEYDAEFNRWLASVKAEAVRECARSIAVEIGNAPSAAQAGRMKYAVGYMLAYADGIERGESNA